MGLETSSKILSLENYLKISNVFQMAAEYLRVQTELAELRQYKAKLAEQVRKNNELEGLSDGGMEGVKEMKAEKEALLAFKEKLAEQLALIEAAQSRKAGSSHSTGESTEDWVVVNSEPKKREGCKGAQM